MKIIWISISWGWNARLKWSVMWTGAGVTLCESVMVQKDTAERDRERADAERRRRQRKGPSRYRVPPEDLWWHIIFGKKSILGQQKKQLLYVNIFFMNNILSIYNTLLISPIQILSGYNIQLTFQFTQINLLLSTYIIYT